MSLRLNLESINETNFIPNKVRKNKRNKTTLVLNINLKNINNTQKKEEKFKEKNENENEKRIYNTTSVFNKTKSSSKKSPKNFFSKNDFKYFD